MILDCLENASLYYPVHRNFQKAFAFIREHKKDDLPIGRYEISADVYALVQIQPLLALCQTKWEAHRNYIDIQFIKRGVEVIGHAQEDSLKQAVPYMPENDIAFYSGKGNYASLKAGEFMILFPHDAHKPLLLPTGVEYAEVEKIVLKVRL
jgi:YhcH/YjgK/YiaL family protein